MDSGDYCWGLYKDYYRDLFPHSCLSARQSSKGQEVKACMGLVMFWDLVFRVLGFRGRQRV